jgi:hypothetical protein
MKQYSRELLVTSKVAQHWQQDDFEQKVDELLTIVSKVDSDETVHQSTETMDVYRHRGGKKKAKKSKRPSRRPFEFTVFIN